MLATQMQRIRRDERIIARQAGHDFAVPGERQAVLYGLADTVGPPEALTAITPLLTYHSFCFASQARRHFSSFQG
jgi:hypothetical protein